MTLEESYKTIGEDLDREQALNLDSIPTGKDFEKVWELTLRGKIRALWAYEPTIAQMAKVLGMPNDYATHKCFQSVTSGIRCGWTFVKPVHQDCAVITR